MKDAHKIVYLFSTKWYPAQPYACLAVDIQNEARAVNLLNGNYL
jgi:hypothetical protein